MELYYKDERDREFFEACEEARASGITGVANIVKKAIMTPASSFFLTNKGYERIIRHKTSEVRGAEKCALYREIKKRFSELPLMPMKDVYIALDDQPAPRFYISVPRGVSLYYELIKTNGNAVRSNRNIPDNILDELEPGFF